MKAPSQTVAAVIRTISDDKSMDLFKIISQDNSDSDSLKTKTKLTRKQYYSRLSRMTKVGLVKKRNGRYTLTAFGKIVHDSQIIIEKAISNYWKLKAIDSLEMSNELPKEEQRKLMESLLDNEELREILIKK